MDKRAARLSGLQKRAAISAEQKQNYDRILNGKLIESASLFEFIGCYVSMRDEADTLSFIDWCLKNGKHVSVPKIVGNTLEFYEIQSFDDLKKGRFGVMEPVEGRFTFLQDIEMMIVPLSSFDQSGNRTGYGRGFYDSVLKQCRYKVGLAYPEQKVEIIETDFWDIRLDEIITIE